MKNNRNVDYTFLTHHLFEIKIFILDNLIVNIFHLSITEETFRFK